MYDALVPFFKWCLEEDYIITHPMITLSAPPAPDARERILSEDEIRQLWKVTNDGWYWSPFYRLLLLTGQRRQEIAMLPREAIDTNAQLFIIPSSISKTKVANALPMLPMISYEFSRSRFLGKNPSGFSKAKAVLDQRLGFSDFRIHDLRRSCASYLALLGTDPWTIERILNHRLPGVQGVYNRYSYLKEKKHALEKWCRYISELT
jgi:integrase